MPITALSTHTPIRYRTRALYSLPGDVLEVRQNLSATLPGGQRKRLPMGLYVIIGQRDDALVLAHATEDEDEQIIAEGLPYSVSVYILETEAVRATYLRAIF